MIFLFRSNRSPEIITSLPIKQNFLKVRIEQYFRCHSFFDQMDESKGRTFHFTYIHHSPAHMLVFFLFFLFFECIQWSIYIYSHSPIGMSDYPHPSLEGEESFSWVVWSFFLFCSGKRSRCLLFICSSQKVWKLWFVNDLNFLISFSIPQSDCYGSWRWWRGRGRGGRGGRRRRRRGTITNLRK